jgi:mannitol-1-phosphate/altronate dehydrogenase
VAVDLSLHTPSTARPILPSLIHFCQHVVSPDRIKYILHKRVVRSRIDTQCGVNLGEGKGRIMAHTSASQALRGFVMEHVPDEHAEAVEEIAGFPNAAVDRIVPERQA